MTSLTNPLIYILSFIIGSCIGSFLNVLVERITKNESINGRSHCDNCKERIKFYNLIPILSYIRLKGICPSCKTRFSSQHFVMEVVTGIMFCIVTYCVNNSLFTQVNAFNITEHIFIFGKTFPLLYYWIVTSALTGLFLSDLKYGMLYDKITIPTIIFVIFYKLGAIASYGYNLYAYLNTNKIGQYLIKDGMVSNHFKFSGYSFLYTILGSLGIGFFFLLLILVTRGRGMGGGDLKLGFLIGLICGWPNMIVAIFLGFLTGAVAGCILLITRKKKIKQAIPFGPFLILACFIVMFFGNQLFDWYTSGILGLK